MLFRNILFLSILFSFCSIRALGQEDIPSSAIDSLQSQGTKMCELLLTKNYSEYVKFVYKPIIDMVGGEKQMEEMIMKGLNELNAQGFIITSLTLEKPSVILKFNNELQCTFLENAKMVVPKGKMIVSSPLIAISENGGSNWRFIATNGKDIRTLKQTLPNLSDSLVLPQSQVKQLDKG